jgi:hypothetical protein
LIFLPEFSVSSSAVDNIFIDITRLNNYQVFPLINGLSDHDAQIIVLNSLQNKPDEHQPYFRRNINIPWQNSRIALSYGTWDLVFEGDDVNTILNSFLNIYLRIFYSSFLLIKINKVMHNYSWRTIGINTCKQKRELYIASRNNKSVIK